MFHSNTCHSCDSETGWVGVALDASVQPLNSLVHSSGRAEVDFFLRGWNDIWTRNGLWFLQHAWGKVVGCSHIWNTTTHVFWIIWFLVGHKLCWLGVMFALMYLCTHVRFGIIKIREIVCYSFQEVHSLDCNWHKESSGNQHFHCFSSVLPLYVFRS